MKKILCILFSVAFLLSLCGCGSDIPKNSVFSEDDLAGKNVGVISGSPAQKLGKLLNKNVTFTTADSRDELLDMLTNGIVDCAVLDEGPAEMIAKKSSRIILLETPLISETYAVAVAKENIALTEDINSALQQLTENGTLNSIINNYIYQEPYVYERADPSDFDGSITLAVSEDNSPYSMKDSAGYYGMCIDIAYAVCDSLGIGLDIITVDPEALIETVQTGQADIAMGRLVNNETNLELVDFSDVYYSSVQRIAVRKR